jgi:hypothetical protein
VSQSVEDTEHEFRDQVDPFVLQTEAFGRDDLLHEGAGHILALDV